MAKDRIEIDLLLRTKKAESDIKRMNAALAKMDKTASGFKLGSGGGGGDKVRALGTGLSKATVRADEFNKSLEASNARVIAFGASAGLIMNIDRALKAMVRSAIQVQKAMADVNVVMQASTKTLNQFGKGMFKVARDTAQGFDTVAEAATELARQGLGMAETLNRTKDALILTRLTGMNAADSVKSLTAAVNSFNKSGVTSAEIVNKMAKVDAAYAVSSEDLARAISRVGSSAVDAGVSMDELMAITTAVQQKTARGGAVIGNAFKTIFTRIQRSDVQAKLRGFGIATEDMNGKMLNGIQVIQNMADKFDTLTRSQQASISESVAGVFQINILKAAMSDLSSETQNYRGALKASSSATDEAYRRNEQLNKTLDSLVNKTLANLTQAGAALGGGALGPAIEKVLGTVNSVIESFGEGGKMEGIGKTLGKGLLSGIGNFISGPGLVMVTAVFAKLAFQLSKFAGTALKDTLGLTAATKQRAALEEIVVATIAKEPALLKRVHAGTLDVFAVEKQILATIREQQAARMASGSYGGMLGASLHSRGVRVNRGGSAYDKSIPGFAHPSRFMAPNFSPVANAIARERSAGVPASAIRVGSSPSLKSAGNPGGIGIYNTIDEPRGLQQGISRAKSMGMNPKTHGFPNFADGFGLDAETKKMLSAKRPFLPGGSTHPAHRAGGLSGRSYTLGPGLEEIKATEEAAKTSKAAAKLQLTSAERMQRAGNVMMMASIALSMGGPAAASNLGANPSTQAAVSGFSNIGAMAMMGASAGLYTANPFLAIGGGLAGAGIGALGMDFDMAFGDKGVRADAAKLKDEAENISEALSKVGKAILNLGELDYMTAEEKIKSYVHFQKEVLALQDKLMQGGDSMKGARTAFYDDPQIQKIITGDVANLSAKDFDRVSTVINSIKNRASDVMSAGNFLDFETKMQNSANVSRGIGFRDREEAQEGALSAARVEERREARIKQGQNIFDLYGAGTQVEMSTMDIGPDGKVTRGIARQTAGGVEYYSGKEHLDKYSNLMDQGKYKEAMQEMIPLYEQTGQKNKAQAFKQMVSQMDQGLIKDQDIEFLLNPTNVRGGSSNQARNFSPAGAELLNLTETGRKGGLLNMMFGAGDATKTSDLMSEDDKDAFRRSQRDSRRDSLFAQYQGRNAQGRLRGGMADLGRESAVNALDARLNTAENAALNFGEGLIEAQKKIEEARILAEKDVQDRKIALKAREEINILAAQAEEKFFKDIMNADASTIEKEKAKIDFLGMKGDEGAMLTMQETLASSVRKLSDQEKALLDYLNSYFDGIDKVRRKETESISENTKATDAATVAAGKNAAAQIKLWKAAETFNFKQVGGGAIRNANISAVQAGGLYSMQQGTATGFGGRRFGITNQEIVGAQRTARADAFRAGQGQINPTQSFRESFAYGPNDAILEFDQSMQDVAGNMKSSFADAFQAIASGSNTVKGALANMAQSILNSISSISANMFSNMLFSGFGNSSIPAKANGGYIPGYAAGGLVTGGSGFKDDVMTKMQGGEFVIKKSAVNQIGLPALNAINSTPGYANGGQAPSMWKMGAISAGAAGLSGIIGAATAPGQDEPAASRNYGMGKSGLGYLGGADPDAGRMDSISGGGTSASVSLAKGYVYYRRDPQTGRLVSERARPTEGRFEVSDRLSLLGRLSEGDPQTSRMFGKEQTMANYQEYVRGEKQSRKDQIDAVKAQKKSRLMGAWMNAAMLIGGGAYMDGIIGGGKEVAGAVTQGVAGGVSDAVRNSPYYGSNQNFVDYSGKVPSQGTVTSNTGFSPMRYDGNNANGGLAKVMGGEYIMSPQAVRTHGVGFMTELNRGNVPGYASGGLVGGGGGGGGSALGAGGNMTNNVKININIDKDGKADVQSSASADTSGPSDREDQQEAQDNSKFGELLSNIVVEEIVKQQRPGGLLQQGKTSF